MSEKVETAKIDPASAAIIAELVREMRKPDPEVQAAKEVAAAQKKIAMESMIAEVQAEEAATRQRQANCSHTKPNGETRIHRGQIYSDGTVRPFCIHCNKQFAPYEAPREFVTGTGF